jgi:hypothetical protein
MADRAQEDGRPVVIYVLTWLLAYMALRDVSGVLLTMHKVPWWAHPAELGLLVVRGGGAALAARWVWEQRRAGLRLAAAWMVGFGVALPLAMFTWDPFATLRGPLILSAPALLPLAWAAWRVPWR